MPYTKRGDLWLPPEDDIEKRAEEREARIVGAIHNLTFALPLLVLLYYMWREWLHMH